MTRIEIPEALTPAERDRFQRMADALDQSRSWQHVPRAAVVSAVWWAVPFVALWSLGVDPTTAARVAVLPWVAKTTLVLASLTLSWAVMASTVRLTVDLTHEQRQQALRGSSVGALQQELQRRGVA